MQGGLLLWLDAGFHFEKDKKKTILNTVPLHEKDTDT